MQKCKSCSQKFTYKEILNSIWKGYKPINCSNCMSFHSPITFNTIAVSILLILPAFFTGNINSYFSSTIYSIFFYILWVVFSTGVSPFIMRYELVDKNNR